MTEIRYKSVDITFRPLEFVRWLGLTFFLLLSMVPILWAFSVSFRERTGVYGPPHLIPDPVTIEPWLRFFEVAYIKLLNSVLVSVGASIGILLIAIPAGYAFARFDFPAKSTLFILLIGISFIPGIMLVVPMAEIVQTLGVYDTIFGQWLGLLTEGIVVATWLLRDNFQKIPETAEEAAQVYGCTRFGAFLRVSLPLATPVIIAALFFAFLRAWTEFFFTSLLTTSGGAEPGIVYLFHLFGSDMAMNWPFAMAGSFIIGLPPAIFYIFSRRYLEEAFEF